MRGRSGSDWTSARGAPSVFAAIDVWAFSPTDVWVIDGSSSIQRYDGEGWSVLDWSNWRAFVHLRAVADRGVALLRRRPLVLRWCDVRADECVSADLGPQRLTDVWASSSVNDVWAVGDDAIVAHDDGNSWGAHDRGLAVQELDLGSGPSDVYALSTFDLVHYDGSTWTEIDLYAGAGYGQVWGTSASDVWVMTDHSELSHFDGAQWQTIDTFDFVGDLGAVWGPSPDDLWAVGSAGAIAHYATATRGGKSRIRRSARPTYASSSPCTERLRPTSGQLGNSLATAAPPASSTTISPEQAAALASLRTPRGGGRSSRRVRRQVARCGR